MKTKAKIFLVLGLTIVMSAFAVLPTTVSAVQPANAQNLLCDIFPFIQNIELASSGLCGGEAGAGDEALSQAGQWIRFGLSLIFVGIIAVAIFGIIQAAIKYIRSEGDEGKVEEATKSIKNVFIGIGALLVGIVGLVIVLSFFGAQEALNQGEDNVPDEIDIILGN